MKKQRRVLSLIFALLMTLSFISQTSAQTNKLTQIQNNIKKTAQYMQKQVPNPTIGTMSGDWTVMALARSGQNVPKQYYEKYYENVVNHLKNQNGKLSERKYTEYSRVILALTAIGKNPQNVGGYNLISYLSDYEKVIYQGINGAIFALIALDSNNYNITSQKGVKVTATRDMYVQYILDRQIPLDGGFSLDGIKSDPDVTAMAIQALSKYKYKKDVQISLKRAIKFLSNAQQKNGGYLSWNVENSESVSQVITALTQIKIDPSDSRFVKNNHTLIDNLLTFYDASGGFLHTKSKAGNVDSMATDQGMYAMIAYDRFYSKKNAYYDMTDVNSKKHK